MRYRHIITITLLTACLINTVSRILADKITATTLRRNEGFMFLDRMILSKGTITINIQLNLQTTNVPAQGAYQMIFAAIPDQSWESYESMGCKMSLQAPQVSSRGDKRFTSILVLNSNTLKASSTLNFSLNKATGYHFVLTDCKKNLVNEYFNKKSKLFYEVNIMNNRSNVGDDEKKLGWLIPLLLASNGLFIFLLTNKKSFSEHNQTDYPKIMILVALYLQVVALSFVWIYFLIYSLGDGNQYGFFGFMHLFFADFCDVLILTLFGFMAFGWNTLYKEHRDQQIYFPLAAMGGFMSVIITMVTKINDGDINKYHMHDTIPTYILMILKFVLFIIFIVGIFQSLRKKTQNMDQPKFFKILAILGSFYFLQLFIFYFWAQTINRCERQVWMFLAFEYTRTLVLGAITWAMYYKKSPYRKVTLINKSFMENDSKYL